MNLKRTKTITNIVNIEADMPNTELKHSISKQETSSIVIVKQRGNEAFLSKKHVLSWELFSCLVTVMSIDDDIYLLPGMIDTAFPYLEV